MNIEDLQGPILRNNDSNWWKTTQEGTGNFDLSRLKAHAVGGDQWGDGGHYEGLVSLFFQCSITLIPDASCPHVRDSGSGVASSSQRARNVGWISFATPSELWALKRIPNTERCWVWVKLRVSKTGKKRNSATKSPKKSASFMSPSNSVKMDTMVTMTHDPSTSIQPLRVSRLSGSPNGHSIQAAIPSFRATGRLWLELQTNRCFLLATFKTWTHFKVHVKETVFFWFLLLEVCNHYKCKLQV